MIKLKGYNISGAEVSLPTPISYEMYIGTYGVLTSFYFRFFDSIPAELVRVNVTKENGNVSSCFVDTIQRTLDKGGDSYILTVTSYYANLLHNQVKPSQHMVYTTENMLADYAAPYGITKSILRSGTVSTFQTVLGMNAWDAITLFCRKAIGGYAMITEDGTLSILDFKTTTIVFGEGGLAYTYLKQKEDRSVLPSRVYMRAYDDESDFSAYMDNEYATKLGLQRVKYYKSPKQWATLTKRGAGEIIRAANLKWNTYEIKVPQYIDLYPGMRVKVKGLGIDEHDFYVDETYFSRSNKGSSTRVVLKNCLIS